MCQGSRLWLIALAALLIAALPARAGERIALVGATVIDGTGAPPLRDATLLIEGERIAAIGPRATLPLPADARVIDLGGRWIIPGLIDAHIHFFQSGGLYTRPDIIDLRALRPYEQELAETKGAIETTLARYLASGVTGVVDVGGPMWNFTVRALSRQLALSPRVAVAGPLLGTHAPAALERPADPAIVRIDSAGAARAEVARQLAERPDLVKIWFVSPGE